MPEPDVQLRRHLRDRVDATLTEMDAWNRSRVRFGATVLVLGAAAIGVALVVSVLAHWI